MGTMSIIDSWRKGTIALKIFTNCPYQVRAPSATDHDQVDYSFFTGKKSEVPIPYPVITLVLAGSLADLTKWDLMWNRATPGSVFKAAEPLRMLGSNGYETFLMHCTNFSSAL